MKGCIIVVLIWIQVNFLVLVVHIVGVLLLTVVTILGDVVVIYLLVSVHP